MGEEGRRGRGEKGIPTPLFTWPYSSGWDKRRHTMQGPAEDLGGRGIQKPSLRDGPRRVKGIFELFFFFCSLCRMFFFPALSFLEG